MRNQWSYWYLSEYYIPAPKRKEYVRLYGPREELRYEDIYKIEYRNKAIYEGKKFVKESVEETQELVIN